MYVYLSLSLSLSLYIYIYEHLSLSIYIYIYERVCFTLPQGDHRFVFWIIRRGFIFRQHVLVHVGLLLAWPKWSFKSVAQGHFVASAQTITSINYPNMTGSTVVIILLLVLLLVVVVLVLLLVAVVVVVVVSTILLVSLSLLLLFKRRPGSSPR